MKNENKTTADGIDRQILSILRQDARTSYSQLGRMVHLTAPAVRERIRRMEESGLIEGYHARIDVAKAGFPVQAILRLSTPAERYPRVLAMLGEMPEVIACHHVTGEDAFYIHVMAESTTNLERVISSLSPYGKTATAVILSTPIQKS